MCPRFETIKRIMVGVDGSAASLAAIGAVTTVDGVHLRSSPFQRRLGIGATSKGSSVCPPAQ